MKNIVLIGMPGCGKTTIGKAISQMLQLSFYDIDEEIQKNMNTTITEIFKSVGESGFRDIETQTIKEISQNSHCVISMGGGAVLREKNMKYSSENGIIIFIHRSLENIVQDVEVKNRPLLKDNPNKIYELYNQRIDLYRKYSNIEIANDNSLEDTTNKILEVIK